MVGAPGGAVVVEAPGEGGGVLVAGAPGAPEEGKGVIAGAAGKYPLSLAYTVGKNGLIENRP